MVEGFEPADVLFPTLIQRYLTGSRAEFLYTDKSDYDYLYEIGPGVVRDHREKRNDDPLGQFYWKPTENPGFYTIEDRNGKFLYSQIVQQKLAPLFLTGQEPHNRHQYDFEDTSKIRAAISYSNKDFVIGLRLAEWPKELLERFPMTEVIEKPKNIPLFLIAKSFPGSPLAKLEWRISFSLVELEIMLNLPHYQRKAFLHWKHSLENMMVEIPSYFLKTTLLTVSMYFEQEHPQEEWNSTVFYKELCDHLERGILEDCIPNFFVPAQNLFLFEGGHINDMKKKCSDALHAKAKNYIAINSEFSPVYTYTISLNDDAAILSCLAETYFQIVRIIYKMVEWKKKCQINV